MTDAPTAGRPACHHCGAPSEMQWHRHATPDEARAHWDALEQNIRASGNPDYTQDRSDTVHIAVHGCGDHALPSCTGTHREPEPAPCPDCHAQPGDPCTKPDGTQRPVEHPARTEAQPNVDTCTHAHAADCGGYDNCQCADDDAAPAVP